MRYTTAFVAFAASAATFSSAVPLARRDGPGPNCPGDQGYIGELHGIYPNAANNTRISVKNQDNGVLTTQAGEGITTGLFKFDQCTLDGWDKSPEQHGQIKPVDENNQPIVFPDGSGALACVTAAADTYGDDDSGRSLYTNLILAACAAEAGDLAARQWFYANNTAGTLTLELLGNPNDRQTASAQNLAPPPSDGTVVVTPNPGLGDYGLLNLINFTVL